MPSGIKVSIGSLMLFIILVALQLVLFQGVWWILVFSPFTIMVLTLNLGCSSCWFARQPWSLGSSACSSEVWWLSSH